MVNNRSFLNIPRWLRSHLNAEDAVVIEQALQELETRSSGEIIPVIVRRSTAVGHVFPILLLVHSVVFLTLDLLWITPANSLLVELFSSVASTLFILMSSWLLSRQAMIQRLLTANEDIERQTTMRAEVEFHEAKTHDSEHRASILLFVSLMEHQAIVMADQEISIKTSQKTWNQVIQQLTKGARANNLAEGFVTAINKCGDLLTEHLPLKKQPFMNNIQSHLIIKL
jgi:putative membrane protein